MRDGLCKKSLEIGLRVYVMEIKTTSILVDDSGTEIKTGAMLALSIGRRNVVAKFDGISSKGTIRLINPITDEAFSIRVSSITGCSRCTFKMEA